jgi:hypothetical protein
MIPTERFQAATDDTVTPFLFWSELAVCAGGAALACPQCATANLHLDTVCFATPTEDHYAPTVGVSIVFEPARSFPTIRPGVCTRAEQGPDAVGRILVRGRLPRPHRTSRAQAGRLFASLQDQPPLGPEDVVLAENLYARRDHRVHADVGRVAHRLPRRAGRRRRDLGQGSRVGAGNRAERLLFICRLRCPGGRTDHPADHGGTHRLIQYRPRLASRQQHWQVEGRPTAVAKPGSPRRERTLLGRSDSLIKTRRQRPVPGPARAATAGGSPT